ncbi:tail fiber assembly protein [Sphingopyxis yananensis]|uniref:tail fiber assembly protein n=1 Tax=Sphingopyxis yananensis TaxID=2886687 RepID=UPI001D11E514|nr:tail fiber assembly protein [Sphingopyxis yananensis]MCC2602539.1 phage tail assembly chaperone [Sphingopyxis yananensis]
MKIFFDPASASIFDTAIHPNPPAGSVEISTALHQSLTAAQIAGQMIMAGPDGQPVAVDPSSLMTSDELAHAMRSQRNQRLLTSDYVMMADYPLTDDQRAAWAAYRQQLRDLPETITDPAAITWPVAPTGESL